MKLAACVATVVLALAPASLAAGGPGGYELTPHTLDSGGGTLTGGGYTLVGTVGQFDAGPSLAGASMELEPGFWPGVLSAPPCPADLSGDGFLNATDINLFVSAFIAEESAGDFNGDGFYNATDINQFVTAFLSGC